MYQEISMPPSEVQLCCGNFLGGGGCREAWKREANRIQLFMFTHKYHVQVKALAPSKVALAAAENLPLLPSFLLPVLRHPTKELVGQ